MTVAILGAFGQLGSDLRSAYADSEVVAFRHADFDVRDFAAARKALSDCGPRVIINTTAFHKVEECEKQPDMAFAVNATAAAGLAAIARGLGAQFVHISTDYVYGGSDVRPLTEEVAPAPVQVYGVSKVAGEQMVLLANPNALIVRSSGLFGVAGASGKGGNFIETVLRLARERGEMKIVTDQVLSPTSTHDLARAIRRLVEHRVSGLMHVTSGGHCSWFDLASWVVKRAGLKAAVNPTTTAEFGAPVRRPAYSVLGNARWEGFGWEPLAHWKDAVGAYLVAKGHLAATD